MKMKVIIGGIQIEISKYKRVWCLCNIDIEKLF